MADAKPTERRHLPAVAPREWKRGDPLTARHLNESVTAIRDLYGAVAQPRQVIDQGTDAVPLTVRQFKVVSAHGDYVLCNPHDGVPGAESSEDRVRIATPYLLRRTPFDGTTGRDSITYAYTSDTERTATDANSHSETQEIVPGYVAGDIIYAIKTPVGGTGVTFEAGTETVTLDWLDLNVDGRAWAAA